MREADQSGPHGISTEGGDHLLDESIEADHHYLQKNLTDLVVFYLCLPTADGQTEIYLKMNVVGLPHETGTDETVSIL